MVEASTWAKALGYDSVDDLENTDGVHSLSVADDEVTIDLVGDYNIACTVEVGTDEEPPSGLSAIAPLPGNSNAGAGQPLFQQEKWRTSTRTVTDSTNKGEDTYSVDETATSTTTQTIHSPSRKT
ncbi:MAG: hypothetical protein U5K28_06710 [Halobacteriales archaeon]|nr:hypothetical protein [Halobacteriales archaeon]